MFTPEILLAKTKANASVSDAADKDAAIVVAGRRLAGVNSFAQRRSGRVFLPIVSIARAFGDAVKVDAAGRQIEIRRQTGVTADFDGRLGQVRENGAIVLVVSNTTEIVFSPDAESLMLPLEISAALLGASIRFDAAESAFVVSRTTEETPRVEAQRNGAERSALEVHRIDYEYNFNHYAFFSNHNLTVSAEGRIGDGRFNFLSNLNRAERQSGIFRNGTFTFERPNGQRFIAGDFGSGGDLPFMAATTRGGAAQILVGNLRVNAFAGRSNSGALFPSENVEPDAQNQIQTNPPRNVFRRDTNVVGVHATKDFFEKTTKSSDSLTVSAGAMRFGSPVRRGEMLASSFRYGSPKLRLQGDAAIGRFSGARQSGVQTTGFAAAIDVSGTFQLFSNLNLHGRYNSVGEKFFSPQSGLHEPIRQTAGGVSWQPKKWLTAAVSGSAASKPGEAAQNYRFVMASVNITPPNSVLPTIFLSHSESRTPQIGAGSFTVLNAAKNFSRWRMFFDATRVKTLGAISLNGQIGAGYRINESNSLEIVQSLGNRGAFGGMVNWQSSNLLKDRVSFNTGFGYNRSGSSPLTTSQRFSAAVRLPAQTSLQIGYLRSNSGTTLFVGWRGSFLRRRKNETAFDAPVSEMNSYGSFAGRVYQDVNLNGQYDAGIDRPQPSVKIRVDGSRYVESDADGRFRIDGVKIGEHQIHLDLLSVRADLTLLNTAQRSSMLAAGRDTILDFRLVRTGRITGVVWLDANANGKFDENEQPLSDVRVIGASGQDTLTDVNGVYSIGDVAPGEHVVLIDEKTLPEKTKPARAPLSVKVLAGAETSETNFPIVALPPEIKRFVAKSNE